MLDSGNLCLSKLREIRNCSFNAWKHCKLRFSGAIALSYPPTVRVRAMVKRLSGAIALSYPPTVRVRAMVKLSAAFFNDESSITIGGGTKVQ